MSLLDFQQRWEAVLEKGFADYSSLTEKEKVWFNVQPILTGGVFDHYMNGGAAHNEDTINAFKKLGLDNIAELFVKMNSLFPEEARGDFEACTAIIESWKDGQYDDFIDELDNEVFRQEDLIESSLLAFVIENKIG